MKFHRFKANYIILLIVVFWPAPAAKHIFAILGHFGRGHRIVLRQEELQLEDTAFEWRTFGT